jgi:hypothetical protein
MPSNRRRSVLSHCSGPCGIGPPFWEMRGSREGLSAWGVDCPGTWWTRPFMKNPALIRQAYSMSEWSWWLCVFLWWSCYVSRWEDRYQHSSAYCQARVGTCGYIFSYPALNGLAARGSWLLGHLLGTGNPQASLPRVRACAEPDHKEKFRSGGHVTKSCRPASIEGGGRDKRDWCESCSCLVLLGWWSLPLRQEWWDHIPYGVLGSPAI